MKTFMSRSLAIALCILAVTGIVSAQGLYWESTTVVPMMGGKDRHTQYYYMPKMLKAVSDDRGGYTVIRLDKDMFVTVNDSEKTYSETSFSDMEDAIKKASSQMEQRLAAMKDRLNDMPEDRRKMVEDMINQNMQEAAPDSSFSIVKGDDKKTINGFSCTKNTLKQGDKELATIWTTTDIKGYQDMNNDLKEFGTRMAALNPRGGKTMAVGNRKVDGFPIQTEMGQMTMTVTKVQPQATPATAFEVPDGYKKVPSTLLDQMNQMNRRGRGRRNGGGDNGNNNNNDNN